MGASAHSTARLFEETALPHRQAIPGCPRMRSGDQIHRADVTQPGAAPAKAAEEQMLVRQHPCAGQLGRT
jgi:hypothetical protein